MSSFNRIILVGNLTRDPQLTYTAANVAVCKFGIATNHQWKDKEGNKREDICFVDCTLFGRGGETFNQYMTKGRSVLVEGRLQLNQWTTPEGEKRSRHGVLVENFTFLGSGGGRGGDMEEGGARRMPAPAPAPGRTPAPVSPGGREDFDEPPPPTDAHIPF